ncbi:MerR family transcriptional regulator [Dokdonella sp.]|uniref:MerR family transcriptional regulator n=1 Tax=Dokdonella sp. TaxID=2291710 RepID=UPI003C52BD9B
MDDASTNAQHSVRVVARRTGLSPDLLRAWERRYNVVQPTRTSGGQRNYSDADIERLQLLASVTSAGRQIGQVAGLDNDALRRMSAEDIAATPVPASIVAGDSAVSSFLDKALCAIENFDAGALETTLRSAALRLPSEDVLDLLFGPLLMNIGKRWQEGTMPPANEHLATTIIRRVLGWMMDFPNARQDAPNIVVATPAFQNHELGAMLAATAASLGGWRVMYLGASLPAAELTRAARLVDADTVALSIVHPTDDIRVANELRELGSSLPESVGLVVGGAGAAAYSGVLEEIGAHRLDSISALRAWLRGREELHRRPASDPA